MGGSQRRGEIWSFYFAYLPTTYYELGLTYLQIISREHRSVMLPVFCPTLGNR